MSLFGPPEPIFKRLEILKVTDLYKINIYKFYYNLENKNISSYFLNFKNKLHSDKKYNLRTKPILQPLIKHEFMKNILCKTKTHNLEGFTNYAKTMMFGTYYESPIYLKCILC